MLPAARKCEADDALEAVGMNECGGGSAGKAGTKEDEAADACRRNAPLRCAVRAHSSSDSAGEGTEEDELDDEDDEDGANACELTLEPEALALAEALVVLRFLIEAEAITCVCAVGGCSCVHVALSRLANCDCDAVSAPTRASDRWSGSANEEKKKGGALSPAAAIS